jgi:integrase
MGVYQRGTKYWQLWLETAPPGMQREKTDIVIGTTATQRHDSRALAELHYHRRMNEIAANVHRLPTKLAAGRFREYSATYKADVISKNKGADREAELLKELVAFFGDHLIAKIDRDLTRAYLTERMNTVSASTANREVDLLKVMLRDAVPKYIDASPLVGMKRAKPPKGEAPKKRRLLQPAEETRLLKAATDPQDYGLIVLGIDTLVRMGDLLELRSDDRNGLWLTIRDPKGGEPYDVPLSPRAAAALDAITHDKPYYFEKFRRAINPRDWRGSVRQRLEKLCAAAKPPVPFGPEGITFHGATRKTGATRLLVDQGRSVSVVQALGNWKKPDVLLGIYTEAQRKDLLAAVGHVLKKKPTEKKKRRSA